MKNFETRLRRIEELIPKPKTESDFNPGRLRNSELEEADNLFNKMKNDIGLDENKLTHGELERLRELLDKASDPNEPEVYPYEPEIYPSYCSEE